MSLHLAMISAVLAAVLVAMPATSRAASILPSAGGAAAREPILVQDDDSVPDEDAVPSEQVDKYIAVYSAMQKNHSLGVEQAASKEGLTVDEFRTLEDKIERNPTVHERVLDALKAHANKAATGSASSQPKKAPAP